MPDLDITIGGRNFTVACQSGEEQFLTAAAQMLDQEAQPLIEAMGRLPEAKMLLMAGLMLADRTSAAEDEIQRLKAELAEIAARPAPEPQRIEVPVMPPHLPETLAEIAARAEALAARIEEQTKSLE